MRKINWKLCQCIIIFVLLLSAQHVIAADIQPPLYKTTPPERKKVIEEDVYFFSVMQYDPPAEITPLKKSEMKSYKTPEEAFISQISAMFNRDYNWWIKGWNKGSQKIMKERDSSLKQTPEFWIKKWNEVMKDKKAVLLYRVESGPFVIIAYSLKSQKAEKGEEESLEGNMVFKNEQGKWLATQEMASDPVLLNWRNPERRFQRVIRDK